METAELTGVELDCWVAKAKGEEPGAAYSSDWCHGGPIIERETIELLPGNAAPHCTCWWAKHPAGGWRTKASGPTPLIAAMRAYVASKFGDEVGEIT